MTARLAETTAEVCANYGMREVGGFGIRGWRVFCPACGFLGRLYIHIRSAQNIAHRHRCNQEGDRADH